MPVSEPTAASAVMAVLSAADYGGPLTAAATAQLQVLANAFAKCISHYAANNTVSTTDTGTVTGAVPPPPPPGTPGVFNGTGSGTIGGLVKGDALSGTGLAGEIMSVLQAGGYGGPLTADAIDQLALLADACAEFAPYVMTNAQVSTTVSGPATTPGVNGPTTGNGTGSAA